MERLKGIAYIESTLEWAQFILKNRSYSKPYYELGYDYAIGPVADGRMRSLIRLYKKDKLTSTEFKNRIKPTGQMKRYTQISVHSVEAVNCLDLKEVEYIE